MRKGKNDHELIIRCSGLGNVMAEMKVGGITVKQQEKVDDYLGREKLTPKQDIELKALVAKRDAIPTMHDLPKGAQTYVKSQVKKNVLEYQDAELGTKEVSKGKIAEDTSIILYNFVFFTEHEKNTKRKTEHGLTGECDIDAEPIIDIKSSWSLATFPAFEEDIDSALYEWQLRGYMKLYNRDSARVAYCAVDTPHDLIPEWEEEDAHIFEGRIEPDQRVTCCDFKRDKAIEDQIDERIALCQDYYDYCKELLTNKNK